MKNKIDAALNEAANEYVQNMRSKEDLAKQLGNTLTGIKDVTIPKSVTNPGLYVGFIKGWEARDALYQQLVKEVEALIKILAI